MAGNPQYTRLSELREVAKDMAIKFGVQSDQFLYASRRVHKLDAELKAVEKSIGQHYTHSQIGNYGQY